MVSYVICSWNTSCFSVLFFSIRISSWFEAVRKSRAALLLSRSSYLCVTCNAQYINLTGSQNFNVPDNEINLKGVKFACDNLIATYIRERFTLITCSRRTTSTFKLHLKSLIIMFSIQYKLFSYGCILL